MGCDDSGAPDTDLLAPNRVRACGADGVLLCNDLEQTSAGGSMGGMRSHLLGGGLVQGGGGGRGWDQQGRAQRRSRAMATGSAMLHVCRRSLRNGMGQDGTTRDAAR